MRTLLDLEELGLFSLTILLFARLDYVWWVYPLLLLTPDLGMIGYAFGPRLGAATYNLTHHKGLGAALYALGLIAPGQPLAVTGLIVIGHSSLDRVFGYGLKHLDDFHHTHLGWIGRRRAATNEASTAPR